MKYDHLIGRQVTATAAKGFTFTGTLRRAQEVSVHGALEVVAPDGTVDFGGLPQAFVTIKAADLDSLRYPLDHEYLPAAGHEDDFDSCSDTTTGTRCGQAKEEHFGPEHTTEVCDLVETELDRLRTELAAANGDKAALQRKVDTHECVPTQWAYDQACKALQEHRARADAAEAKSEDEQRYIRVLRQQITDLRAQVRPAENDLRDLRERAAETAYHDLSTENAEMADKIRALPLIVDNT